MNPLSKTSKVKTMVVLLALCAAVISVAAAPANAYDYRAEFLQMAGWLTTQQVTSGGNLGGIWEGEDYTSVVQTDNTAEAIWIWSRYAELTGDYTTYITNINNAWTYCDKYPSWLESGTPTNYYNTYNVGWGLLAEMKYRQVYQGRPEYVNHTSYGTSCANHLVNNTPGTSTITDALCLGIASGTLYQYGVNVSSATYKNRAVVLGGNVRTWLNGSTSRFASEGWAVSGGIAVWGVLNSYYKDPNYSGGAATWAGTANTYMPLNAANGSANNYEYGHDGWYAWGHYAVSEHLGSGSFTKYQNLIDLLLGTDGDNDGGIRQGLGFTDNQDYAWTTNCMQFASNLGLISLVNYTISGTVTSSGSPLSGVTMSGLSGNPVTDANGFYSAQVGSGWSGTVTPTKTGYTFSPTSRTYSNVTSDQTAQDYTATPALPGKATSPSPANTATNVSLTADLSWTAGSGATSHIVYFGTISPGTLQGEQGGTTFDTGTMNTNTTYYWRIDEKNAAGTTTGVVWSFTTVPPPPGAATAPSPADTATNVGVTTDLGWTAGSGATSHIVYFGTSSPGTLRGEQAGTTYDTGTMSANTTYYWRIDEKNAGGTTTGTVWSFTTQTTPPALPWSDGFESGNFTAGGWTISGNATVATAAAYTGSTYGAKLAKEAWIEKAISTAGFNNIHILYNRTTDSFDAGEYLYVEWSINGTNWIQLEATQQTAWASKDLTCDPNANNNLNFRIRFRTNASAANEYAYVDDVQITGTPIVQPKRTLTSSSTDGGNVTTPGEGAFQYDHGTVVNLVATADVHYHFVNWTGDTTTIANVNAASTTITMNADYVIQANFAIDQMTIFGYITKPDANIPVEGVVVNANNGGGSDTTDANGYYELTVDYGWSGAVEPNKTGYTFEPNSINYSNVTTDQTNQDYTATLLTYVISGYVLDSNDSSPIDGVLMSGLPGDPCTNGSGYYSAVVDYGWSDTVTPTKYAYAFEPNSIEYTNVIADQTGQDYAGTLLTYSISGCILDPNDAPVDGVLVSANNGGGLDTTDPNGYYEVWVSYNWSGTVTPTDEEYTFAPANRPYSNVLADQANQDYVGTSIYDLYPDGIIDLLDLDVLCENWLTTGPGDFDNDGNVDFRDFAEFASVW